MASFEFITPESITVEYLRDYHTFGRRGDTVDTAINASYVSKLHIIIEYREPNWLVRDVSRNGVKLNNKIIPAQKAVVISAGDMIDFGGMGEYQLRIRDLGAPKSLLINQQSPTRTIAMEESLLLPDEQHAEVALYLCPDRNEWFSEAITKGEELGPYEHGDLIQFSGSFWRFFMVADDEATTVIKTQQQSLENVTFRFHVSQNEESTSLEVVNGAQVIDLGERSHHYLLLHLFRFKHSQPEGGGWIDSHVLMKELGLEETHLNIQIFRARKQIAEALKDLQGHSKLIERRRGEIRFGLGEAEVFKEGVKEQ